MLVHRPPIGGWPNRSWPPEQPGCRVPLSRGLPRWPRCPLFPQSGCGCDGADEFRPAICHFQSRTSSPSFRSVLWGAAGAISIATRREGYRRSARSRLAELVTTPNFSQAHLAHYLPGNGIRFPTRKAAHQMPTGPPSRTLWPACRKRFCDCGACLLFSMGSRLRGRHECLQRFASNSPVANSRHTRKQATLHEPINGLVRNLQIRRDLGDGQGFGPLSCGCDDHSSFPPSRVRLLSLRNSRHDGWGQACRARGTPRHDTTQRTAPTRDSVRQPGRTQARKNPPFSLCSFSKHARINSNVEQCAKVPRLRNLSRACRGWMRARQAWQQRGRGGNGGA